MNRENAIAALRDLPLVARSVQYLRSEWRVEGKALHFAVRENCEHGGSFHSRQCAILTPYQAKAARKVVAEFA